MAKKSCKTALVRRSDQYGAILAEVVDLLESARRTSARAINAVMTATYWQVGRRIVENEQGGASRAGYGEQLLQRLSEDLTDRFGRGFSVRNLQSFRTFYLKWPIQQMASAKSALREIRQMSSAKSSLGDSRPSPPKVWPTNGASTHLAVSTSVVTLRPAVIC